MVPDTRIATLWADVNNDVGREQKPGDKIECEQRRTAVTPGNELCRIMMVGWVDLLDSLEQAATSDSDVTSDIRQLKGLAMQQDREAFSPLRMEDLASEFPRRLRNIVDLIDVAIYEYGVEEGWVSSEGLRAQPQYYGYGRYFRVSGVEGSLWFGLNYDLWATNGKSPLWLWLSPDVLNKRRGQLKIELFDEWDGTWTPIYLKTDADRYAVLEDMARQLKAIADAVKGIGQGD